MKKKITNLIYRFKTWNPSVYATILILLLPTIYFAVTKFRLDNDFWFLINTGKVIMQKGFITIEPFTIHSNLAFIPQQWLTDIIFYLIYSKFSVVGMFVFLLILNYLIVFLLYKLISLICKMKGINLLIALILNLTLLVFGAIVTRPHTIDIILLLLEIIILESYVKNNKKKYLYFIPLISVLFINFHSSTWLMLFVFMLPYYVEWFYKMIKKEKTFKIKPVFIVTIISFFIGFINPYNYKAIIYLFNSYGNKMINDSVLEMLPVTITSGKIIYLMLFVVMIIIYLNKGKNKIRYICLFLGTTYLMLSHYRGLLFWIVIIPLIIGDFLNNFQKIGGKKMIINNKEKIVYCILIVSFVLIVFLNAKFENEPKLKEIADYLDKNANYDIKLYTGYNDGSYMEYRGYKCYIDPRAEVFLKNNNKKEDIFSEYYKVKNGESDLNDFFNKYNFDYLLVDSNSNYILYFLKNDNDYENVLKVKDKEFDFEYYLFKKVKE